MMLALLTYAKLIAKHLISQTQMVNLSTIVTQQQKQKNMEYSHLIFQGNMAQLALIENDDKKYEVVKNGFKK